MGWIAAFFEMLLQGLQAALAPAAGCAVVGGLVAAWFHWINPLTLVIILLLIAAAFSAPSIIAAIPHG